MKSVDFSPDNKCLLAAGKFKKLKFFDLETLAPKLEIEGHTAGSALGTGAAARHEPSAGTP